jgi:arylsulfatase A-like enzyme/Tfp pilus assembly protein PilF
VDRAEKEVRSNTNVLLITLDTLRWDHLGTYGNDAAETPNIDALAARGVQFDQAIAQIPLTTPSHASILTGTYSQVHKIRDIGGFMLDKEVPTISTLTRKAGFETAAFVGASVLHRRYGLNAGFSVYNDDMAGDKDSDKLPGVVAEVRGEVVTDRAIAWIKGRNKASAAKPFFLWVHYYDPHFPYDPPEPFRSQFKDDLYSGEIAYMDHQLERLFEFMSQGNILEQTLVVLLADHGESLGEHGEYTHGVFLYDSTMHVPLIFAGPDIPAGKVIDQQVRSIDVMPTILDYLGLEAGRKVQGSSLVPALMEQRRVRTNYCYMETLYPRTQMRWSELRGMRTDNWKLIIAPKPELYNLQEDPLESENLEGQFKVEADRLQKQIWEINGPPESWGTVESQPLDEETRQELQSLGYVSAGGARELIFDGSGVDPKDRVHVLERFEVATDLMNHNRYSEAVPLLEGLSREDPGNPLVYQHLGMCFQNIHQFDEARKVYLRAIENEADTDRTFSELGEVYVRLGQQQIQPEKRMEYMERAVENLRHSSEINPSNLDNLSNLASAYLEMGRISEAEGAAKAILAQSEKYAAAFNILGMVHLQRQEGPMARLNFEKAIQVDPSLVEPYMNLGLLANYAGEKDMALHYFKLFLERATDPRFQDIVPRVREAVSELEAR